MIRLKTFGTPQLRRDDGPIAPGAAQRRRLAVLALLAVAGDEGVSREKLIGYLWPDAPEEQARHTLAQALYLLRRELPDAEIVTGSAHLRLDPAAIETDVAEFRAALTAGDVERAAAAYTGPFLDGFYLADAPEFERWTEAERARLAGQARAAFERAARDAVARGDSHRAVEWWRRVAAIAPLETRAAMGLMQALIGVGDRTGALQHARVHEALVREELDAPPDPAVTALVERLRASAPSATPEPPHVSAPAVPPGIAPEVIARDEAAARVASTGVQDRPSAGDSPRLRDRARTMLGAGVAVAGLLLVVLAARTISNRRAATAPATPVFAIGAVRDYSGVDTSGIARALADMLATNLARLPDLHVVSNARIYELLGATRQRSTEDLSARLGAAARQAGASEIVEGTLYRLRPGQLRFDVRRVDVTTGAIRKAYSVEGADAFELVDRATGEMAADIGAETNGPLHVADVTTRSLVAYRFYEEGLRAYYQQNDIRAARRLFRAALAEDSSFAMADFYAAETERGLGVMSLDHYVRAARLADRASDRERLLIRGSTALWTGEPAGIAIAETLATRYPTEPDGHYLLGQELIFSGDFLGALPHLRRVVQMDSLSLRGTTPRCRACDALQAITSAYWLADSLAAAERVAREWTDAQPDATVPWATLSGVLLMQGRYQQALAAQRTEERVAPGSGDPLLAAYIALRNADFAVADPALRRRVRDDPASDAPWFLSLSLRYQGRLREALALFQQPSGRAPRDSGAVGGGLGEAIVLFDMGRYREAARLYSAFGATPNFAPGYPARNARDRAWMLTHAATARATAGDTSGLAQLADTIQRLGAISGYGRDQRLHHYVRGLLLRARGDLPAAAEELRRGIFSLTDGYTRNSYELARTLMMLHRPAEAIAVLRPALSGSLQASNSYLTLTEVHELLAQAFDAAAQPDSAGVHYRWVVRAWAHADPTFHARWQRARARLAIVGDRSG